MASYYETLGIGKSADEKEIRRAYRRMARKHHPDLNPGDKEAEKRFKEINEAHEVLSDRETRKKYDTYGDQWRNADRIESQYRGGGSPFGRRRRGESDLLGGLDDFLSQYGRGFGSRSGFGTRRIEAPVTVSLEEAFSGTRVYVNVPSGQGDRRIEVSVPPGVDSGSVVHVSLDNRNEMFMNVTVSPHKRFQRKGADLYTEVTVPLEDAMLGGETNVQTLSSRVSLKVPPESQNGQRLRMSGQGMPKLGEPDKRGDLYVTLRPALPKNLTDGQRELIVKLKELRSRR